MLKNRKINRYKNRGRLPTAVVLCFINVFTLLFCFVPFVLNAQIEITEIMYNPGEDAEGSKADGGREWIEIYNPDLKSVNLDGWKLVDEENRGHPFSVIQGSFILESKKFLIIADIDMEKDDSTFLTDYPDFSGTVLNSNFSGLNNTSDIWILRRSDLVNISRISYLSVDEAKDTGNSFQKIDDENWGACAPTPGELTTCDLSIDGIVVVENFLNENPPDDPQDETPPPTTPTPTPTTVYKIEPQIFAQIIPPRDIPIAGADFFFEAKAFGLQGEPLQNAEYQWTFGDGARVKGQKVLHNYQYPSDYLVVLEVISGKYSASDRLKIKTIPSDIVISEVGIAFDNNFIELHNPSTYELNLSWWRLRVDNNYFAIPKNTILLPKSKIKFSSRTTNLFPQQNSLVNLLYPNGSVAFNYIRKAVVVEKKIIPITQNPPVEIKSQTVSISQTQTASIQTATQNISTPSQPVSAEPLLTEDTSSTSLQQETQESQSDKGLFNKWTMSLAGVISLAVVGVAFTTKLDK